MDPIPIGSPSLEIMGFNMRKQSEKMGTEEQILTPLEASKASFLLVCQQYNQMGKQLAGLSRMERNRIIVPGGTSDMARKTLFLLICDQHSQMGEQLKDLGRSLDAIDLESPPVLQPREEEDGNSGEQG
jgi:hypothetical protein